MHRLNMRYPVRASTAFVNERDDTDHVSEQGVLTGPVWHATDMGEDVAGTLGKIDDLRATGR